MRIGIDFGTCFSSAALLIDGNPKPIKSPDGQGYSLPSSVYILPSGDILVGRAADRQRARDTSRYKREFKRDLGAREPFVLGGKTLRPEELVAVVLGKLKGEADQQLPEPLTAALLTVPATYSDYKRGLMEQAALAAGFSHVELLEEPVAAAIAYAQQTGIREGEMIVVYDLGGGTFDTAVLRKRGGGYEFLGLPDGIWRCGGTDFDQAIYSDLISRCSSELRDLLSPSRQDAPALLARSVVLEQCIDLKHQLSQVQEAEVPLIVPGVGSVDYYSLSRQAFERMIAPYIEETLECCRRVVKSALLQWSQVDRVLLVGGSCRIPYVQERLKQAFGRPVSAAADLELVVCEGAALFVTEEEEQIRQMEEEKRRKAAQEQARQAEVERARKAREEAERQHRVAQEQARQAEVERARKATDAVERFNALKPEELTLLRTLTGHSGKVRSVAFSPDGQILVSGSSDKTIKVWNWQTGQLLRTLTGHSSLVHSIAISPDGQTLVSGSRDDTVKVWNLHTGELLRTLSLSGSVMSVAISPDGQTLVSGSADNSVEVWNLHTGELLRTLTGHSGRALVLAYIVHLAISPDGQILASSSNRTVKVWSLHSGALLYTLEGVTDRLNYVNSVAISPDRLTLVSGGSNRTVKEWNLYTGYLLRTTLILLGSVMSVAISPDGQTLASGGDDKTIKVWNLHTMKLLRTLSGHSGSVESVAFSPDGQTLASGSTDKTIKLWGKSK